MPVPKKKETYSQAMARLEKIVNQIDNNELEIDQLAEKIKDHRLLREQTDESRPGNRKNTGRKARK